MLTGEKLVSSKHPKKHLDKNCSFIDDLVSRLSETDEIYDLGRGKFPSAVWKF